MKVLIIGSGGREHTLAWKLAQSTIIKTLFVAPGNAGTAQVAINLDLKPDDFTALANAVKQHKIDLIVVGPETPLVAGIVDYFQALNVPVFGPSRAAAQLEGSKAFAKDLFLNNGLPCAQSQTFSSPSEAKGYISQKGGPLVIKADGLAAGKGVIMAETTEKALEAVSSIMENRVFGSAGDKIVIEEWMLGQEMSFFAVTDGRTVLPLAPACDYKRIFDQDIGPNTGGMGSYSPTIFYTPEMGRIIMSTIIEPTVKAMAQSGRPYRGVLYAGLMIKDNQPRLLEYNVRFGDPECQVILPRLKSDLMDIILGVVNGNLDTVRPVWNTDPCVGVVMASGGYPGSYQTGYPIHGLDKVDKDVLVFHSGTRSGEGGLIKTAGGRVLTVVASGSTLNEARRLVYANIRKIRFKDAQFRSDIANF